MSTVEEMHAVDPQDSNRLYALSAAYEKQADICFRMDNVAQAQKILVKALTLMQELGTRNPHVVDYRRKTVNLLVALGNTYRKSAEYKLAEEHYVHANTIAKELCAKHPNNSGIRDHALAIGSLGLLYREQLRKREALDLLMKSANLLKSIEGKGDFGVKEQLERTGRVILHTDWS